MIIALFKKTYILHLNFTPFKLASRTIVQFLFWFSRAWIYRFCGYFLTSGGITQHTFIPFDILVMLVFWCVYIIIIHFYVYGFCVDDCVQTPSAAHQMKFDWMNIFNNNVSSPIFVLSCSLVEVDMIVSKLVDIHIYMTKVHVKLYMYKH